MYRNLIKRILDIFCALIAMAIFCWLYVIIAILVKVKLGSPVIFAQERPGMIDKKTGMPRIFKLYKFRSMTDEKDSNGNMLPDSIRLTRFGKMLRATSLDELPEAFNILIGDMSVIGPRPWLVRYLDYYNDTEMKRQKVRPGLSGLAQVSGRNGISWKKRFELDIKYVENVSFLLDIKIILLSIKKMIIHEGIEFTNNQTIMQYFSSDERLK